MGSLPQDLAMKWKAKHNRLSEAAFSQVAADGQKKSSSPSFFKIGEMAVSGTRK